MSRLITSKSPSNSRAIPSKSSLTDGSITSQRFRPGAKATAWTTCFFGWTTTPPASTASEEATTFASSAGSPVSGTSTTRAVSLPSDEIR